MIFIYVLCGILNKVVVDSFQDDLSNILLNNNQLEQATTISKDRKELLFNVYKKFGSLADLKLREIILSEGSPAAMIYSDPTLFYLHLQKPVSYQLPKELTKSWFNENFMN